MSLLLLLSFSEGKTYTKPRGVDPAVADEFGPPPTARMDAASASNSNGVKQRTAPQSVNEGQQHAPGTAHVAFCAS